MSDAKLDLILSKLNNMETELKEFKRELKEFKQEVNERFNKLEEGQKSLKIELKKDIKDLSVMTGKFAERFDTIETKLDEQGLIVNRLSSIVRVNSSVSRNLQERIEYLEEKLPL